MSNKSQKALNIIRYSVGRKRATFGHGFDSAYHSLNIDGELFKGQREISKRLSVIPFDFSNKVVLDMGCNIGGMLHELKGIKYGIGLDYNSKCINAANFISQVNGRDNLSFYTFDFDKEDINFIENFCTLDVDMCFILAMALWIKQWKELIKYAYGLSPNLLYETNGNEEFQQEQVELLKSLYSHVEQMTDCSNDDNRADHKRNKARKLFLCLR